MPAQTHDVIYYSHNKTYYIYIYKRHKKNEQHSLFLVLDQKILSYKMRYKEALKITNDTSNKVKYCQLFSLLQDNNIKTTYGRRKMSTKLALH